MCDCASRLCMCIDGAVGGGGVGACVWLPSYCVMFFPGDARFLVVIS